MVLYCIVPSHAASWPAGTTRRPVPLQHSLYFGGELYTICSKEVFVPEGVRAAVLAHKKKNEVGQNRRK